jgi:hypothetical protein
MNSISYVELWIIKVFPLFYDIFDIRTYINSHIFFDHFNCNYNSFSNLISQ